MEMKNFVNAKLEENREMIIGLEEEGFLNSRLSKRSESNHEINQKNTENGVIS
jgi:hypothetical protein